MSDEDFDRAMHQGGFAAFQGRIARDIAKYGFHMLGVFGTEDDPQPSFTYTIGLFRQYGYELIIFGLPYEYAGQAMHRVYALLKQGQELKPGESVDIDFNFPLLVMEADEKARGYVCQADNYYGEPVRTLQLVLPDRNGKYPGEVGYDVLYMGPRQPLLYEL